MTPERYQRLQLLADIASELEPDRRRAYLDEQCAGDEALRRDVERLLAADDRAGSFLEKPAMEKFAGILASDQPQGGMQSMILPKVLQDRYSIEQELGRGGIGAVYLARDRNLHSRRVVIKVLQTATDYLKRKFHGEIEALTRFEHRHIVKSSIKARSPTASHSS